jgi:uncharacterized protein (TIGR02598 family)
VEQREPSDAGFGLVELTIAMAMMAVALLALVAALTSGIVTLQRSGVDATAATLADKQMERYRAITYAAIQLDTSSVTTANSNSVYTGDSSWNASQVTAACAGVPVECKPMQTVTGPDTKSYRIDSYIVYQTPASGRQLKLVTVVVRDPNRLTGPALARLQSRFDPTTG